MIPNFVYIYSTFLYHFKLVLTSAPLAFTPLKNEEMQFVKDHVFLIQIVLSIVKKYKGITLELIQENCTANTSITSLPDVIFVDWSLLHVNIEKNDKFSAQK